MNKQNKIKTHKLKNNK